MNKYCKKCGSPLKEGNVFCTGCGEKITDNVEQSQEQPAINSQEPTKNKGLKPWQIALIAGGGVLVAIIIVIVVASSCGSNKKDPLISTTKHSSTAATTKSSKTETTTAKAETTKAPTTAATTAAPTTASVDYSQYAGAYQPTSWSGAHCPCMDITDKGSYIAIDIIHGGGISGYTEWTMTARKEGNKLVYTDCTCTNVKYSSTGAETKTVSYSNNSGYFTINGSQLDGSGTKDFSSIVFEKH